MDIAWETESVLSDGRVGEILRAALRYGGRADEDVSVTFVDEATLTALHGQYLDDPTPTDVISFELGQGAGPVGELYVSVDRAREVVAQRGGELEAELALYLVHGVLHLCGYDDHGEQERARMRRAELEVLSGLGVSLPEGPHEFG